MRLLSLRITRVDRTGLSNWLLFITLFIHTAYVLFTSYVLVFTTTIVLRANLTLREGRTAREIRDDSHHHNKSWTFQPLIPDTSL